jgi:hypothetical protein
MRCFTSGSVPRRKSCWMSTGVASVARRLPHASIALALTRMSESPIAWTKTRRPWAQPTRSST